MQIAAADTFRAAAVDQLAKWGERAGVRVIRHEEGGDPGAVVFDALQSARSRGTEVLLCDTAGQAAQQEKSHAGAGQDQPHYCERISGGLQGNVDCSGCDYRAKCLYPGKVVS